MINTDTYKGIYAMHKYWGKKPFNEISRFIEKYTVEGETVMDCFCGSGVTLIEALKAKRKCVGIDLNPIAIKLAKVSTTPVSLEDIYNAYAQIENKVKSKIQSLYTSPNAHNNEIVTHVIWKNSEPIEVWSVSDSANKKLIREGTAEDKEMANNPKIAPKWYPKTKMYENSRINVEKGQTVADLFTPRAIVCLSLILDEINKIKDPAIRDIFEITFSGTLSQASKLVFVIRGRKKNGKESARAEVGSWVIGYWVPEEHFEINVWNCFENRYKKVIKGIEEVNSLFLANSLVQNNLSLFNTSSTNIPCEDNSIDYVFIDPPHANRILYMEQSLMWNAWLKLDSSIDWNQEIIVSEAKDRKNKNQENYNELLDIVFSEIRRVLKPNKYFSLAFNCLDDKTWIDILNLFVKHGFEISDIVPLEYSATSVVQDNRKNALKTDFVLTFRKSTTIRKNDIIVNENENELRQKIQKIAAENCHCETYNVINALFVETISKGYIYKVSHIVKLCEDILPKNTSEKENGQLYFSF